MDLGRRDRQRGRHRPHGRRGNLMILSEALELTGIEFYEHLDHSADVPRVDAQACQGDVSILRVTLKAATTPLPPGGVVLIRSEATSHTHVLHGTGVLYDPAPGEG